MNGTAGYLTDGNKNDTTSSSESQEENSDIRHS